MKYVIFIASQIIRREYFNNGFNVLETLFKKIKNQDIENKFGR